MMNSGERRIELSGATHATTLGCSASRRLPMEMDLGTTSLEALGRDDGSGDVLLGVLNRIWARARRPLSQIGVDHDSAAPEAQMASGGVRGSARFASLRYSSFAKSPGLEK
uniref:Uncharacterized protein n=1 Tax=Steinernema glaseri TaxID=37863 RepID=A0A1I7ZL01_9BILA